MSEYTKNFLGGARWMLDQIDESMPDSSGSERIYDIRTSRIRHLLEQLENNMKLNHCKTCNQMTNHIGLKCQKCKKENTKDVLKNIQKDLDDGKFGMICSNEQTFKDYIKSHLDRIKAQHKEYIDELLEEIDIRGNALLKIEAKHEEEIEKLLDNFSDQKQDWLERNYNLIGEHKREIEELKKLCIGEKLDSTYEKFNNGVTLDWEHQKGYNYKRQEIIDIFNKLTPTGKNLWMTNQNQLVQ